MVTLGTMRKTSRDTAVMNGNTMNARMSPAVSSPMPRGGPSSSHGILPSGVACSEGMTYFCMIGTRTNKPHMP